MSEKSTLQSKIQEIQDFINATNNGTNTTLDEFSEGLNNLIKEKFNENSIIFHCLVTDLDISKQACVVSKGLIYNEKQTLHLHFANSIYDCFIILYDFKHEFKNLRK